MKLFFLLLLFPLHAEAQSVWPLQFHCGSQSYGEGRSIAYRLLVFAESVEKPQVAHFQEESLPGKYHRFCDLIAEAIATDRTLEISTEKDGENLRLVSVR